MGVMAALLAAVDEGLGACFFGVPPDRGAAFAARFGVPRPATRSAWSVSATRAAESSRRRRRVAPANELVHVGRWRPVTGVWAQAFRFVMIS